MMFLPSCYEFDNNRCCGHEYDTNDDDFEVVFQVEAIMTEDNLLQVMPGEQHGENPCNTSDYIKEGEFLFFHLYDPGNDRRESANDRQEPGQNDGATSVLIVEILCLVEVFFLEEKCVLPFKEKRPAFPSEPITDIISDDPGQGNKRAQ